MDKQDVWELYCISNSAFDKMIDNYKVTEYDETVLMDSIVKGELDNLRETVK